MPVPPETIEELNAVATLPAGLPVAAVVPAWPELMTPDVVTTIDVRTPPSSGTDVDWFSAKIPDRPELMVDPGKVVTLAFPSLEMARMPLDVVLAVAPVTVALAPTMMLIG